MDYRAAGGVTTFGTGDFISQDRNGDGAGVAWGVGDLANASAGALTVIFDVNSMQTSASAGEQALAANLVGFVGEEVAPVPLPASLPLLLAGFGGLAAIRKMRKAA